MPFRSFTWKKPHHVPSDKEGYSTSNRPSACSVPSVLCAPTVPFLLLLLLLSLSLYFSPAELGSLYRNTWARQDGAISGAILRQKLLASLVLLKAPGEQYSSSLRQTCPEIRRSLTSCRDFSHRAPGGGRGAGGGGRAVFKTENGDREMILRHRGSSEPAASCVSITPPRKRDGTVP